MINGIFKKLSLFFILTLIILSPLGNVFASNDTSKISVIKENNPTNEPSYSVVILNKDPNLNSGDETTFDLFITGYGDIKFAKLNVYTDGGFFINAVSFETNDSKRGDWLTNQEAHWIYMEVPLYNYNDENKMTNLEYGVPPVSVRSYIPRNIDGDRKIYAILTYQDISGNWYTDRVELKFHINTWIERNWIIIAIGAIITVVAGFITIYKEILRKLIYKIRKSFFKPDNQ